MVNGERYVIEPEGKGRENTLPSKGEDFLKLESGEQSNREGNRTTMAAAERRAGIVALGMFGKSIGRSEMGSCSSGLPYMVMPSITARETGQGE